jgi:hypothetical protein
VGKEELVGLFAAIEWSLAQEEATTLAASSATVDRFVQGFDGLPGVDIERLERNLCGQPIPLAVLHFRAGRSGQRDEMIAALWERYPRIAELPLAKDGITINLQLLQPGEEQVVLSALQEVAAGWFGTTSPTVG